ncbi:MAG: phosphoribose diphosphate:decaprenyl-phosphate phosphoribosyltransferase [Gemmatimonadetes bacterium]|nr:phosphoribose diphosphate:decaprenyl-phosphate phosphoribosyltransferase [Gemmatimonadota bacterium]
MTAIARSWLALLRPRHWIKNSFVLAPTIFAGLVRNADALRDASFAALLFSLAASAIYILNDILDAERDKLHPVKRLSRPIASGAVSQRAAGVVAAALLLATLAGGLVLPAVLAPIGAYVALNIAYSLRLKHVAVVDLFCVASGFVLRVYAGARAVDVPLSEWMLVTTLALSLYLASGKRRQELAAVGGDARVVLSSYTIPLLDGYAHMSAAATIVFYSLYVISVRPQLVSSIPLVLFGIFRYGYLVQVRQLGESPTDALWTDLPLALTLLAWVGVAIWAILPR